MKGMGGGMQQMMRQANQMQNKMKKLQEELAQTEFEGSAGGGAVTVKVTGANVVASITISPDVFSDGDAEILQDLVLAATNDALKTAKTTSDAEMSKITGGLGGLGLF
ncbi:MAG: YbaB/EbfC family nucleoid-associated protein [Bdellovibrionales bacterium]|nr:YbaB/EbfC family nucleoid-associated protein [Bdellovibrionales bacterium]